MDEPKIKIGFSFKDEYGNNYEASSEVDIFESLGDTVLSVIGDRFNVFLKQIGFTRKNDNILMKDLTDDELELLSNYLNELRSKSEDIDNE